MLSLAMEKYVETGKIHTIGLSNWYEKELKEFFVRLREAMDNLDMDAMEDAVKDMDIYSYSGEHKEFYEDIKNAVEDIDIEQCEEIIGKWEESLQ